MTTTFYLVSNPLVIIGSFETSYHRLLLVTAAGAVVTLPWLRLPVVPWPWLAFLGLCVLSMTWSIAPGSTWDATVLYAGLTLAALVTGANVDLRVLSWGIALGGVVVTVLSLYAFEQDMPGASYLYYANGIDQTPHIAGIGTNPNIWCYTQTIAIAAILATPWPRAWVGRLAWVVVLGLNLFGIYRAGSGTGYVAVTALVCVVVAFWAIPRLSHRPPAVRWAVIGGALAAISTAVYVVVEVLHRDLITVSNRAPFWDAIIATLGDSWFAGHGWGAVWNHGWHRAPANPVLDAIYAKAGYHLAHGHNYFVDVLPELGAVGVVAAVTMVAFVAAVAHRRRREPEGVARARLVALVLVALLTFGITEPMFTVPIGWWTLTVVAAYVVMPTRRQIRRRRRARHRATAPGRRGRRDQLTAELGQSSRTSAQRS